MRCRSQRCCGFVSTTPKGHQHPPHGDSVKPCVGHCWWYRLGCRVPTYVSKVWELEPPDAEIAEQVISQDQGSRRPYSQRMASCLIRCCNSTGEVAAYLVEFPTLSFSLRGVARQARRADVRARLAVWKVKTLSGFYGSRAGWETRSPIDPLTRPVGRAGSDAGR